MRTIELSYSLDAGTTWSEPVEYQMDEVWCNLAPEIETDGSESRRMGGNAVMCQKATPRHQLNLVFNVQNFNPALEANTGDAAFKSMFLEVWLAAPLRRMYFPNGSTHFFAGWDLFDANDNTNYLNYVSHQYEPQKMVNESTGRKLQKVTAELTTRNKYTLLTWDGSSWN